MNNRILFVVALGIVVSYALTQGAYEDADHAKAAALVRDYRIGGAHPVGPSLGAFLDARHADRGGEIAWSTEIRSGCRGVVRVTAAVPRPAGAVVYRFDADLPQKSIHPADPAARDALAAFAAAAAAAPP